MEVSKEAIDAYKTLMTDPKSHRLDFDPLSEIFQNAEEATAKHLVYDQYLIRINANRIQLPKLFFYIVMDGIFKQKIAADGNLGYCVRVIES